MITEERGERPTPKRRTKVMRTGAEDDANPQTSKQEKADPIQLMVITSRSGK
jgi:hypothetical protein